MSSTPLLHYVLTAPEKKDVVLEQFNRTNSIRDRMRKFTEPSQSPNVPALRKAPLRNGTTSGSSSQTNLSRAPELFTHTAASVSTSGDRSARPHVDSHTSAASQSQATPQPRGVANKPLSSASQWQNSMGGTRHPAEKDVDASSNSKEDRTPAGRAAGQQVTQQGEADPDMKTFLTIEIKDGRTTTSSTSSPRGNIVPITNMTPRITTNALGQRAGRSINLTATVLVLSQRSDNSLHMMQYFSKVLNQDWSDNVTRISFVCLTFYTVCKAAAHCVSGGVNLSLAAVHLSLLISTV